MNNRQKYEERHALIEKAIKYEPVERIPCIYMGVAFAPRYMGVKISDFCTDHDIAFDATLNTLQRLDRFGSVDGINQLITGQIYIGLSTLWLSKVAIPGRELPEDSLWQVLESEVMTLEDYDIILEKGWPAFLEAYFPRILDMRELQAFMQASATKTPGFFQRMWDAGFDVIAGAATTIPFEYLSGGRSMSHFVLDLYRMPDKVQAVMDAMMPALIGQAVAMGQASLAHDKGIWVGGWRAASALVAPKLWDRFVWPYYLQMVHALVENGITPVLHWDQDWTRDLERLKELPAKKCILNPDGMTDIRKAKKILDGHMAILGDVPANLFAAGTPEDIRLYVRDLVQDIGSNGLLLCPGCDAPIDTKPENMEAFVAACDEFGKV